LRKARRFAIQRSKGKHRFASILLVEELKLFLSETTLNKDNYKKLLRKFGNEKDLLDAVKPDLS
jgi:type I restriction enzyme R subunit